MTTTTTARGRRRGNRSIEFYVVVAGANAISMFTCSSIIATGSSS